MFLAVIVVAVAGDQHLRPDLPETVEHAVHAEVGRRVDQMAPSDAAASRPTMASGMLGIRPRPGRPRRIPRARIACCARLTAACKAAQLNVSRRLLSPQKIRA